MKVYSGTGWRRAYLYQVGCYWVLLATVAEYYCVTTVETINMHPSMYRRAHHRTLLQVLARGMSCVPMWSSSSFGHWMMIGWYHWIPRCLNCKKWYYNYYLVMLYYFLNDFSVLYCCVAPYFLRMRVVLWSTTMHAF